MACMFYFLPQHSRSLLRYILEVSYLYLCLFYCLIDKERYTHLSLLLNLMSHCSQINVHWKCGRLYHYHKLSIVYELTMHRHIMCSLKTTSILLTDYYLKHWQVCFLDCHRLFEQGLAMSYLYLVPLIDQQNIIHISIHSLKFTVTLLTDWS